MPEAVPKIAVVGTNIGCLLHVRALKGAGFDVVALVGRDPERTAARAAHFSIPHALTSVDAAIDLGLDAMVVATPPATHYDIVTKAVAVGLHVLCEKPLALDLSQAREMQAAAEEAGVVHRVVHPHRWFAHHAMLRELARGGALGRLIQGSFIFDVDMWNGEGLGIPDWWNRRETGGGWLRNYNAHGIDLVRYMLGEIVSVSGAVHVDAARGVTADDGYSFVFQLDCGMAGVMSGSARARDFHVSTRVIGTEAAVTLGRDTLVRHDASGTHPVEYPESLLTHLRAGGPDPGAPEEKLPPTGGTRYEALHSSDRGYAQQVALSRAFLNQIRDRSYSHPAVADFRDGVAHTAVIAAVELSARERRWVDVADLAG